LGEVLKWLIPLPIPASIYGLVLMLVALCTGIITVENGRRGKHLFHRNYAGNVYSGICGITGQLGEN